MSIRRKVLRDTLQGITDPGLLRLARKAGAKRVSRDIYPELRGILAVMVEDLIKSAATLAEHNKRKTIGLDDVEFALENQGQSYGGQTTKSCKVRSKKPLESKRKKRARPGTDALREINYYQRYSDCLALPKGPFKRVVKEKLQWISEITRISANAADALQTVVEDWLVGLLRSSVDVAITDKHKTLSAHDVSLAYRLRKGF